MDICIRDKTCLVTGAGGFLGSHLCELLLSEGAHVIGIDNFYSCGYANVDLLKKYPNFEFIRHDVNFPIYLEVDVIFNLACPASPVYYQKDPVQTIKTCVQGVINMLGLAKRTGAIFFQASTSEIYGDPELHPQVESYCGNVNPLGIRACYDEGKRAAETIAMDYHRQHGVDVRIARIFNTYGPRMMPNDGRVVSNVIKAAILDQQFEIYGTGQQTRSFCYVSDLIRGIYALTTRIEAAGSVVNLGNPKEITINQLVDLVSSLHGKAIETSFKPLPQDDPVKRQPDISLATEIFDFSPNFSLEDGLSLTYEYFRGVLL